jgi:hypothetical protein
MHNLDKSMLTLAAHTESADAFLIKVGKGGTERMHKAGRNRRIRKTHSAGAP